MQKIILHIPHSAIAIPVKDGFLVTPKELKEELLTVTDWFSNDLFQHLEAIQMVAPFSKLFCNVSGFLEAKPANQVTPVVPGKLPDCSISGGDMFPTLDANGNQFRKVSPGLKNLIVQQYYQPYQDSYAHKVTAQLRKHNSCLIIDCHVFTDNSSKPSLDLNGLPETCIHIGTDPFHTPADLAQVAREYFESQGLSCQVNTPYTGAIVPQQYYLKDNRVQALMISVNRDLYLKRKTRIKTKTYQELKKVLQGFIALLANTGDQQSQVEEVSGPEKSDNLLAVD